jgi:hypothetical protein
MNFWGGTFSLLHYSWLLSHDPLCSLHWYWTCPCDLGSGLWVWQSRSFQSCCALLSLPQKCHISNRIFSFTWDLALKKSQGAESHPWQPTYVYCCGSMRLGGCRSIIDWWEVTSSPTRSTQSMYSGRSVLEHNQDSAVIIMADVLWLWTWLPYLHLPVFHEKLHLSPLGSILSPEVIWLRVGSVHFTCNAALWPQSQAFFFLELCFLTDNCQGFFQPNEAS